MAVGTLVRRRLVEDYGFVGNHFRFFVTFVTENFRVASSKGEMRTGIVIKGGRNPALYVVALCAVGLSPLGKLPAVRFNVAIFANL